MEGPHYKTYGQCLLPKCVVTSTNKPTWPHCLYGRKFQISYCMFLTKKKKKKKLLLHQCNVECACEEISSQYRSFLKKFFPARGRLLGYKH